MAIPNEVSLLHSKDWVTVNERLRELCEKVAREQDPHRFLALVQELNRVLEEDQSRNPQTLQPSDQELA